MDEKMVGSSDLMPDWFEKYKGIKKEMNEQLLRGLRTPGDGLTLDHLQAVIEHRNPFAEAIQSVESYADKLMAQTAKLLSKRFGKKITVDHLPAWFTEENLAKAAKFNLRPIFLPGEEIGRGRPLRNWVKPNDWFYHQIQDNKIAKDSAYLKRGWYLADFTLGADYDSGTQVFQNDPLSPIITRLRQEGKIGKNEKTPMGSRFAIVPKDEWPLVLVELANELGLDPEQLRLERAIEFNAIGNIYDSHRGQFNMWEWFTDDFGGASRLYGGARGRGGLTNVHCDCAGSRYDYISGRPLVSF